MTEEHALPPIQGPLEPLNPFIPDDWTSPRIGSWKTKKYKSDPFGENDKTTVSDSNLQEERQERLIQTYIPIRDFLYTPDQIASIIGIEMSGLRNIVSFAGREGDELWRTAQHKMRAAQVVPSSEHAKPEWRIPESELIRYLKKNGIVTYERKMRSVWR